MLSYMIPVEDKSSGKNHLQLELDALEEVNGQDVRPSMAPTMMQGFISMEQHNGRKAAVRTHVPPKPTAPAISTESSVSSLSSTASQGGATPTSVDKYKPKLAQNGGTKATSLKRVSFGSSKGSMVETLIYESPLQEEPETATPTTDQQPTFPTDSDGSESKNPSTKVRVTFFECERPHVVNSPEPDLPELLDAPLMMTSTSPSSNHPPQYNRQASTDSGWDNPFRPDGDLSREADEIVERIKEGKPITGSNGAVKSHDQSDGPTATGGGSPSKNFNGTANCKPGSPTGAVEVQRTVVTANNAEPEHIVIKKKPKGKCCVIQ